MRRRKILPKTPAAVRHRAPRLKNIRNLKMARSAHAYVRGSTARFYEWLAAAGESKVPEGPPVWICGDCHTGNLGPVTDAEGHIAVQIRDLDQTVIGNPAHDLIRLGLSISMSIRGSNLPGVTTALALEALSAGYLAALESGRNELPLPGPVKQVVDVSQQRRWGTLAKERIQNARSFFPLGKRFWPVSRSEQEAIIELFRTPAVIELLRMMKKNHDKAEIKVEDCSYWMKGCSSLGNLRYAVLVSIKHPKSGKIGKCIVDIKQAVRPLSPPRCVEKMPTNAAERVVAGARHLSPHLGGRMLAAMLLGKPVFLRELAPQDLKLELDQLSLKEAVEVARYLAAVVGAAHARQLTAEQRTDWAQSVRGRVGKKINAPSWLWSVIVKLVADHEAGYLEHCRQHALAFA